MFYAELNNENKVKAILSTPKEIISPLMIEITSYDAAILGQEYVDGDFIKKVIDDVPEVLPKIKDMTLEQKIDLLLIDKGLAV